MIKFYSNNSDISVDENIGYNRQPIKLATIFIILGMQNETLNPKSITKKEIPDYHNFLFCEKCSEFYYVHKIQPFTLFSQNKIQKCNELLIFGYIKLSNIPRNFSKSLESFRNPSKLFEIPKNFLKSLKTSWNPLKHLQIPRNFSNLWKLLQIRRNLSKSLETSPNPSKSAI